MLTTNDKDEFTDKLFQFNEPPEIYDTWLKIIQYKLACKLFTHLHDNEVSDNASEFEYSESGKYKNSTLVITFCMKLSPETKRSLNMDTYLLKNSNSAIKLSFDELNIQSILHKESDTILARDIPLSSQYTVEYCGNELMTEYEALLSSFNHYSRKDRLTKLPSKLLTMCDPNDSMNRTIQITIASMLIDSMGMNCFHFNVEDGLIYYTHSLEPSYDSVKNLPIEYFNEHTFKQLKLTMNSNDLAKLKNLKKLTGGGS